MQKLRSQPHTQATVASGYEVRQTARSKAKEREVWEQDYTHLESVVVQLHGVEFVCFL